jgi:radical SAM protein (TIGR01212 family)
MDIKLPFNNYSNYLIKKYGRKAFRVSIDIGLSCPNRGKDRTNPGCIYCDGNGARATYLDKSVEIKEQVERGVSFLKKRYNAEIFLLYIQAFSGTYGETEELKEIYDYCLSLGDFREIIVSTRPDCIDEEKAEMLSSYREKGLDVWVELGLQSSHDRTLERINRGHTLRDYEIAFKLLRSKGIKLITHLIFGLPDEDEKDMLESVKYLAAMHPEGIKIHNLHVPFNTPLFDEYLAGELSVPCGKRHISYLVKAIELIPDDIVIMRVTCDTPDKRRAAPKRDLRKGEIYSLLSKAMIKKDTWQGKYY